MKRKIKKQDEEEQEELEEQEEDEEKESCEREEEQEETEEEEEKEEEIKIRSIFGDDELQEEQDSEFFDISPSQGSFSSPVLASNQGSQGNVSLEGQIKSTSSSNEGTEVVYGDKKSYENVYQAVVYDSPGFERTDFKIDREINIAPQLMQMHRAPTAEERDNINIRQWMSQNNVGQAGGGGRGREDRDYALRLSEDSEKRRRKLPFEK